MKRCKHERETRDKIEVDCESSCQSCLTCINTGARVLRIIIVLKTNNHGINNSYI
jgi:hypothetical protein